MCVSKQIYVWSSEKGRREEEEESISTNIIFLPAKDSRCWQLLITSPICQQQCETTDFRTQRSSGGVSVTPRKGIENFNCIIAITVTFSVLLFCFSIKIRSRLTLSFIYLYKVCFLFAQEQDFERSRAEKLLADGGWEALQEHAKWNIVQPSSLLWWGIASFLLL